jgi:hypothetical protein
MRPYCEEAVKRGGRLRHGNRRRGYALVLVLIFIVLFLGLLGVGWRQLSSALRIASVRTVQTQRDEGSVGAMAAAMALLETGRPPADPCVFTKTVTLTSGEQRFFRVTFERETGSGADTSPQERWTVTVTRQSEQPTDVPAMPASFSS